MKRIALVTKNPLLNQTVLSMALSVASLGVTLGYSTPTHAERATAQSQRHSFVIAAASLDAALIEFARISGSNLSYTPAQTAGKRTSGVSGSYSVSQALDILLVQTGLKAVANGSGYQLEAAPVADKGVQVGALMVVTGATVSGQGVTSFTRKETESLGFPLEARKAPATINTVTPEVWQATSSRTLDEVLSTVPGISLTDNGGWTGDTTLIRGFSSTLPYRDGMRAVDSGYKQSLRAMPDNIERIEIVKGPAGAEFGVAEPGGAVNFITKKPTRETIRDLTLGMGQDGYRKVAADLSGALTEAETVQGRLVIAYVEPEEWRDGRPDDTYSYTVAPSFNWDYSDAGQVLFQYERAFQASPQDRGIIYLEGAWEGGFAPREWSFHQTSSEQDNQTDRYTLDMTHDFSDALTLRATLARQNYSYELSEFRNGNSEPGWGPLYNDDGVTWSGVTEFDIFWDQWMGDTQADSYRAEMDYRFAASGGEHTLTLGLDGFDSETDGLSRYTDVDNTYDIYARNNSQSPNILQSTGRWMDTTKVNEVGTSAKWLGEWTDDFRTVVGVRRFDYDYDYAGAYEDYLDAANNYLWPDAYGSKEVSYRVALSYELTAAHTVFAGFSDAYKPQGGKKLGDSPLDPMHDVAVEVGIKSLLLDETLSWNNAIYRIKRTGESMDDPTNGPDDSFVVNGGEARITGIETELHAKIQDKLELRTGASFSKSEIIKDNNPAFEGNRFANTPHLQVSAQASYQWTQHFLSDLGVTRIGERYGDSGNTIKLPGYTLINAAAQFSFNPQSSLRLDIANLADETYYTGMQDSGARADQIMVGGIRSAFLTYRHSL